MEGAEEIVKKGYLRKQKTMKKKFFVLRDNREHIGPSLEYYDSEKKFSASRPKRCIALKDCFNINSKSDAKNKHAIVLYTKEDCFTVVCDEEDEKNSWLAALLKLRNYDIQSGGTTNIYEHIWPVTVKSKGLGSSKHLMPGQYRLCLTSKEISFIRPCLDQPDLVLHLACVRRCGHTECFFYLEIGRTSVTGSGDLWMQVEDIVIAQNIHETVLSLMTACKSLADQPQIRPRRHSNVDKSSKPSTTPSRQRGTISGHNTSGLPQRSNTISAADDVRSPLKRRLSQSPSKSSGSHLSHPRPVTISGHATLPASHMLFSVNNSQSVVDSHRPRTDSMESTGSRNTNSVSADELDSPHVEESLFSQDTSTPVMSKSEGPLDDSYVPMTANPFSMKVGGSVSEEAEGSDYFEVGRTTKKLCDNYMQMTVKEDPLEEAQQLPVTSSSSRDDKSSSYMDMSGRDNVPRKSSESHNGAHDGSYIEGGHGRDDTYSYMDMGSAKGPSKGSASEGDYKEMSLGPGRSPITTMSKMDGKQNDSEYIPMLSNASQFLPIDNSSYVDMSCSTSTIGSSALSSSSSLHEFGTDIPFQRSSGGNRSLSVGEEDEYFEVTQDSGYLPMEARSCSPRPLHGLRPDRVASYLIDDSDGSVDATPQRSFSVGSRQQVSQNAPQKDGGGYLDMSTKKGKGASSKSHQKTSSAPHLNNNNKGSSAKRGTSAGDTSHSQNHHYSLDRRRSEKSRKEQRESKRGGSVEQEEDSVMEMTFSQKSHVRGHVTKDHDYEEIRPRSSSGGAHDFRSSAQERRRAGSIGYNERLSKFASLARASMLEYRKSDLGHRPRIATISQDTFRKRTSSFGTAASDMRPRSSSHGNSRYMDMSGRLRKGVSNSQHSSQDSLPSRHTKHASPDPSGTHHEYLEMRPRVSTSPSPITLPAHTLRHADKSRRGPPRSPLPTDSDYLSMEPSKSSSESSSSADYATMDLPGSHADHAVSGVLRSRSKRSSVSSGRGTSSHSSSESLASSNSQSSDGRGSDRTPSMDHAGSFVGIGRHHRQHSSSSSSALAPPGVRKGVTDDSYVLYSPSSSQESSPVPERKLDKVSCAIRMDDTEVVTPKAEVTPRLTPAKDGHEYINVNYPEAQTPTNQSGADQSYRMPSTPTPTTNQALSSSSQVSSSHPPASQPFASSSSINVNETLSARPPPAPSTDTGSAQPRSASALSSSSLLSSSSSCRATVAKSGAPSSVQSPTRAEAPTRPCPQAPHNQKLERSTTSSSEPVSDSFSSSSESGTQCGASSQTLQTPTSTTESPEYMWLGPQVRHSPDQQRGQSSAAATAEPTPPTLKASRTFSERRTSHRVQQREAGPATDDSADYRNKENNKENKPPTPADGAPTGTSNVVRPRPRLPSMPVPFPTLGPVTPQEGTNEVLSKQLTPSETPGAGREPSSERDDGAYIQLTYPTKSENVRWHTTDTTEEIDTAPPRPPHVRIPPTVLSDQAMAPLEALGPLSDSKSSLNSLSASDKELNYATLDLHSSTDEGATVHHHHHPPHDAPVTTRRPKHAASGGSEVPVTDDTSPMEYAQIDFDRSKEIHQSKKTRPPFEL